MRDEGLFTAHELDTLKTQSQVHKYRKYLLKSFSLRRISVQTDKDMLKQAVVQNLVTEEKRRKMEGEVKGHARGIKFTTDLPEIALDSHYEELVKRIEVLERAVKGLIELVAEGHDISDRPDPGN